MGIAFTALPENFDVRHLVLNRHQKLFDQGLDQTYFDVVMGHFVDTLREMKIDEDVVEHAIEVISPLRDIFVLGAQEAKDRKKAQKQQHLITTLTVIAGLGIMTLVAIRTSTRKLR